MINRFDTVLEGPKESKYRAYIQKVVNEHNHTEFRDSKFKDQALANLIQHVSTKISKSILNQVASQQGTDMVSEPLEDLAEQSPFGTKDYQSRYGNAAVKPMQITDNQTGKSGIAITASVGIKTFFAITQYFNIKLNNIKDPSEVARYLFDIQVDGKSYKTIANINIDESILKDWETNNNLDLQEMAKSIRQNDAVDADTTISGVMTLAVDNAKKLELKKLNASSEILGLYLYGIAIGIKFEDLVKIFTSNVADVLNENISGNVFNGQEDLRLGPAINKFLWGPNLSNKIFNVSFSSSDQSLL